MFKSFNERSSKNYCGQRLGKHDKIDLGDFRKMKKRKVENDFYALQKIYCCLA